MSSRTKLCLLILVLVAVAVTVTAGPSALQDPEAFANIADPVERSRALFVEAGKVLLHPRCINCHPAGDVPRQGDAGTAHQPLVLRGKGGDGVPGLRCGTCHTTENFDPGGVPGAPRWHLAPRSMAWEGRSLAELCAQLKDQDTIGLDLEDVAHHMEKDALVGWAWEPGEGREAPPGTQEQLGALIRAWIASGAACPAE